MNCDLILVGLKGSVTSDSWKIIITTSLPKCRFRSTCSDKDSELIARLIDFAYKHKKRVARYGDQLRRIQQHRSGCVSGEGGGYLLDVVGLQRQHGADVEHDLEAVVIHVERLQARQVLCAKMKTHPLDTSSGVRANTKKNVCIEMWHWQRTS